MPCPVFLRRLSALALTLALAAGGPVRAGSLGTSSAVGGSSASSATSASSEASSDSSSRGQKTAAGPYRIIDLAAVPATPGQPAQVRLQLLALSDEAPEPGHVLVLPQATAAAQGLAAGQTVTALPRPYGTEFRRAADAPAFFLVLADGFQRELDARPLPL